MANRTGNYCAFYVSEPFSESNLNAFSTKDFVTYNQLRMWKGKDAVSGNYKCRFSVNKNASVSASLISDLQSNKILKNVIFEDCFSIFQSERFTG